MIQVTVGNNVKREKITIDEHETLRAALEGAGVDPASGVMHLDGASLNPGDLNRTFAELGYDGTPGKDSAFLLSVIKAD